MKASPATIRTRIRGLRFVGVSGRSRLREYVRDSIRVGNTAGTQELFPFLPLNSGVVLGSPCTGIPKSRRRRIGDKSPKSKEPNQKMAS